jgi:diguanylate cyclase (GGDEF)-like protein
MAKPKKTPLERLEHIGERLRETHRAFEKLAHPERPDVREGWHWVDLPAGGAALLSERGEILLKTDEMSKAHVARAIADAPSLRKEKFGILFDRRSLKTNGPELLSWEDGTIHALLFLDLDGMKDINDRIGHDVGDEILQIYFTSVAFEVRRRGEAYCWGGDEVIVLLPGHDQSRAEAVRDEIVATAVRKCSAHPRIAAAGITVGLSVGVHVFDEESESLDDVIKKADAEMYKVKNARKAARSVPAA